MFSKSKPELCTHEPIKVNSSIAYDFIISSGSCKECGMKVKIQILTAAATKQKDMSVLQYVEHRVRRTMTVYSRMAAGLPI